MSQHVKGLQLCLAFFDQCAKPIIDKHLPALRYTAGLFGYGSDVLGYDDAVSSDHMWGPRFYMLLDPADMSVESQLMELFSRQLPREFMGYSTNFSQPDPNDGGVRHAVFTESDQISPLIWFYTVDRFVGEYLGGLPADNIDWLTLSEHRLLGFTSGALFHDALGFQRLRDRLGFFPRDVALYQMASQWSVVAEEQAFVRRCADRGDELGSRLAASRIADRLMRVCFLFEGDYAPYSKWFGTAFGNLKSAVTLQPILAALFAADTADRREHYLVQAQVETLRLQNESGITPHIDALPQNYFSRNIRVIYANNIAEIIQQQIADPALMSLPLIGTLGQVGNLTALSDHPQYRKRLRGLYE